MLWISLGYNYSIPAKDEYTTIQPIPALRQNLRTNAVLVRINVHLIVWCSVFMVTAACSPHSRSGICAVLKAVTFQFIVPLRLRNKRHEFNRPLIRVSHYVRWISTQNSLLNFILHSSGFSLVHSKVTNTTRRPSMTYICECWSCNTSASFMVSLNMCLLHDCAGLVVWQHALLQSLIAARSFLSCV